MSRYRNLGQRLKRKKDSSSRVKKNYKSYTTPYYFIVEF